MDPITFIRTIAPVISAAPAVKRLLSGEVNAILGAIGSVHFKAAARSLSDAAASNEPRREIEMAIAQLRVAYESQLRGGAAAQKTAYQAACLIAVCYRALREHAHLESELQRTWTDNAIERFNAYASLTLQTWNHLTAKGGYREARGAGLLIELVTETLFESWHPPTRIARERAAHEELALKLRS